LAVDEESHTTLESNRNGIIGHVKRRVYDEDRATPALLIRDPLAGGKRHAGTRGDVRDSADRDSSGAGADVDSFKGSPTDGAYPESGLIGDSAGNLYGTTFHRRRVEPGRGVQARYDRTEMVRNPVSPYSAESKFIRRGE
jgi:hypothetical protein